MDLNLPKRCARRTRVMHGRHKDFGPIIVGYGLRFEHLILPC